MTESPWIFVVEDSDTDMYLLERAMESQSQDRNLIRARDGEEAVHTLLKLVRDRAIRLPEFVLLDLNLPRIGGHEVLSFLRASQTFDSVPVIITSSAPTDGEKRKALAGGADAFFVKPFDLAAYVQLPELVEKARLKRLDAALESRHPN